MGGPPREETKARARINQPVDIGGLIQRTARMAEGTLDLLEVEYVQFQAEKRGVPKKFVSDIEGVSKMLNELTLAHARYRKAEDEWAQAMTPEQKLEATRGFLLALHKDQPDLVRKWLSTTATAVNHATAATIGVVKERVRQPTDQEVFEANDPGAGAWGP